MNRCWLVLAVLFASAASASASLGGTVESVDADRVHVQGALLGIAQNEGYTVHELQSAKGTVIREFVSPEGTVYGIAWQGAWMPDLQQVLGSYFDEYKAALRDRTRRRRGAVSIETPDLVVQIGGHQRSISGRAWVPKLVPQGVQTATIR